MKYRLIASDFDDTLYDEVALSPRTLKAIADYRAAGGKFCVATGRIFSSIRPFIPLLGVDDEVIACQGSAIYHASSGEVIHKFALDKDAARIALTFFENNGNVCHAYSDEVFFVEEENPLSAEYAGYCGVQPTFVHEKLSSYIDKMDSVNKVISIMDESEIDGKMEALRAILGDRAEVTKSSPIFLEVTSGSAGKGNALEYLAARFSVPMSETAAVGDNLNDLSMVVKAGLGCSVGNGVPYLRERADLVLPSVYEDGVAVLIERILADEI